MEHAPILLRDALNANLKVVSGYKGSADIRLAIDSGEIGGFFNPWSTVKASSLDKFTSGQWSVILQLSDQSLPDLPSANVPTIPDLTADESQRMLLRYGTLRRTNLVRFTCCAPACRRIGPQLSKRRLPRLSLTGIFKPRRKRANWKYHRSTVSRSGKSSATF